MHTLTARMSFPAAAVLAASAITVTPAVTAPPVFSAVAPPVVHSLQLPDLQLAATVADIFQFPAFQQWVKNQIADILTIGAGLAKAGQGVGQTVAAFPQFLTTVTQQVLSRDLLGALTTSETYLVSAVAVIGGPILAAIIQRNQRALAVDQALEQAVPAALIGFGTGLLGGFDTVARSVIIAGHNVVAALLPINLGNLVTALVNGVQLIGQGLATGAGAVVNGIVFAQQTIATALATQPVAAAAITSVPKTAATVLKPVAAATTTTPTAKPAPATATRPTANTLTANSVTPSAGSKTDKKPATKTATPKAVTAAKPAA